MGISGEVITTPFTFAATTHALYWNKIRPVFVDIEQDHYTLDPAAVEAAITPWTTAILAVHVYGFPCKVNALADIARRHRLALIYDAAHAFGVSVGGRPISHFGDMSMFSFHATKLFHSIEGGMLTFRDPGLKPIFDYLKNFGFQSEVEVVMPGTNAKMNEMQALMGILVFRHLNDLIANYRRIETTYRECLQGVPGIHFTPPQPEGVSYNEVAKGCSPQLFTEPVALESPFRPVMAHRDLFAGATESFFLPEPSPSLEDLIRFQVWTSPDQTFDWIRSELFLKHSVDVQHRVGFEILGNRS
jgi:dTDP-4-amino-4,6-dideoxygalactose transaminase